MELPLLRTHYLGVAGNVLSAVSQTLAAIGATVSFMVSLFLKPITRWSR